MSNEKTTKGTKIESVGTVARVVSESSPFCSLESAVAYIELDGIGRVRWNGGQRVDGLNLRVGDRVAIKAFAYISSIFRDKTPNLRRVTATKIK